MPQAQVFPVQRDDPALDGRRDLVAASRVRRVGVLADGGAEVEAEAVPHPRQAFGHVL
jgi:hypothetical protein